jgi:hypothetical protein
MFRPGSLVVAALATVSLATPAAAQEASPFYVLSPAERAALAQLTADSGTAFPLIDSWHAGIGLQYYTFGRDQLEIQALYRVRGGGDVFTSVPGVPNYGSIRLVYAVQLARGTDASTIRSHTEIQALALAGRATIVATGRMINVPVVPPASTLERDPANRPLKSAWFKGAEIHYFDFGPSRVEAIPQVLFITGVDSTGQLQRVAGQPSNVSFVPPHPSYRDLWDLTLATVGEGFAAGTYRDMRRALADERRGHYTLTHPGIIVNCPVVYVNGKPATR